MSIPDDIAIMRQLYERGFSLGRIGQRFGLTRQAIQCRFKVAGIPRRSKSKAIHKVDIKLLKRLIRDDGLSKVDAAWRLGVPVPVISRIANENGLKQGYRSRKFPVLNSIKVGESVILPQGKTLYDNYMKFYVIGRKLGFKLSANRIDDQTIRVTRVA